jgi:hypothetical protein
MDRPPLQIASGRPARGATRRGLRPEHGIGVSPVAPSRRRTGRCDSFPDLAPWSGHHDRRFRHRRLRADHRRPARRRRLAGRPFLSRPGPAQGLRLPGRPCPRATGARPARAMGKPSRHAPASVFTPTPPPPPCALNTCSTRRASRSPATRARFRTLVDRLRRRGRGLSPWAGLSYYGIPIPAAVYARCVPDGIARPVLQTLISAGWTPGMPAPRQLAGAPATNRGEAMTLMGNCRDFALTGAA